MNSNTLNEKMKLPLNQSGWVNNQMGCDEVASFHNLTANGKDINENGYETFEDRSKVGDNIYRCIPLLRMHRTQFHMRFLTQLCIQREIIRKKRSVFSAPQENDQIPKHRIVTQNQKYES